jgi:hypothetical protein
MEKGACRLGCGSSLDQEQGSTSIPWVHSDTDCEGKTAE